MKKQYFYILLFLLPTTLFAQVDYLPFQEVGFNIGFLVSNVLRNEPPSSTLGNRSFALTYKQHYFENAYARYGFSVNFRKVKDGNRDPEKSFQTSFRIGYEYKFSLNEKWHINRGGDAILNYFVSDFNFSNDKTKVFTAGVAPFIGIQYNINPRVNLSTETGISIFYVNQKDAFEFNLGTLRKFNGSGVDFRIFGPQELILSVAF